MGMVNLLSIYMSDTNHEDVLATHESAPLVTTDHDTATYPLLPHIQKMLDDYIAGVKSTKRAVTPIHVDDIALRIAKFYEMVRKVVDWKEDNALRRSAIERVLKRTLFPKLSKLTLTPDVDTYRVSYTVTADLIRGGHLLNDEIPEESVLIIETALKKYLSILAHATFTKTEHIPLKQQINFAMFIIELAACEIEEILTNPINERVMLETMTTMMSSRIRVRPDNSLTDDEKKTQVYIAVCRTLFDLDDTFILAQLIKFTYQSWSTPTAEDLLIYGKDIPALWEGSTHVLEHPLARQFYAICERMDTVFMLIGDILETYKDTPEELQNVFEHKDRYLEQIKLAYDKRYFSLKSRLSRLAIFSTLSVFLSNWATFFIIEVPMASIFYEGFNLFTTIIDFVVPTVIMALLVSIIHAPGADNIKSVLTAVTQSTYSEEKTMLYDVYMNKRRNKFFTFFAIMLYSAMMFGVLGGTGYIFYYFKLPITSVIFDTFTIALTFFAAVLIRNKSKELTVDDSSSIFEFFMDMLSVPIARVGSYLAAKWKEYNIVAILFTFLIETPMVVILDFIENWSTYLKERRADLH